MAENGPSAVVLKSPHGTLEITGSEGFVLRMAQAYHLPILTMLNSASGISAPPVTDVDMDPDVAGMVYTEDVELPDASEPETPTNRLLNWYAGLQKPTARRGRVQDHVMLFIYYHTVICGFDRAKSSDVTKCFETCGIDVPKTSQAISAIRKTTNYIRPVPHGKRDHQLLTKHGLRYIELRYRILTVKT